MKLQNINYQTGYVRPCLKNRANNQTNTNPPNFGTSSRPPLEELPTGFRTLVNKLVEKVEQKGLWKKPDGNIVVNQFKTPTNLINYDGDILVESGTVVNGDYYARGMMDFNGILLHGGKLTAEEDIFVESPKLLGQIKSHQADIEVNADSFNGLVLEGKNILVRSKSNSPSLINQAFIKALEDVHIFCPLDCSMITGGNIRLHPGAVLRNTRINAHEVHINSRLERGTVINAKTVIYGEDSQIDANAEVIAEQIF